MCAIVLLTTCSALFGSDSNTETGATIYAGGSSLDSAGVKIACYWKDGQLVQLPSLDAKQPSAVTGIAVLGGDVYAVGYSAISAADDSELDVAGYWKNEEWFELPRLQADKAGNALAITMFEGDLYAFGYSRDQAGVRVPGMWKNRVWTALPSIDSTKDARVYACCIVT